MWADTGTQAHRWWAEGIGGSILGESQAGTATGGKKRDMVFETVTETYTRVGSIGNGGAGHVYQVKASDGNMYALKVLSRDASRSTRKVKRFLREALFAAGSGGTKGIVEALDVGFTDSGAEKRPFYVMKLYDGSLRALMREQRPEMLLPMLLALFSDLRQFYEDGNVHRDIKPENILYDRKSGRLLLADLGTTHLVGEFPGATIQTDPSERLANFKYAAPEQCEKSGKIDQRTDEYAFGLILNEVFTGAIPRGTNYKTIGAISEEHAFLDQVVVRMISQRREGRYRSLDDVLIEIEAVAKQEGLRKELAEMEANPPGPDDETRSVVSRTLADGALLLRFDAIPSRDWVQIFKSYPKSSFSTDGYYFETYRFPIDGPVVTIPRAGEDERRMREALLGFDEAVAWTNGEIARKRERDARIAHEQAVRKRQSEYCRRFFAPSALLFAPSCTIVCRAFQHKVSSWFAIPGRSRRPGD